MYYHSSKEYVNKNVYLDDSRNSSVDKILNITITYIVQFDEDDWCSFLLFLSSFLRINSNQLLRYLVFDEITSLNFINLSTRSLTTTFNDSLIDVSETVFIFERLVFSDLASTQVSFLKVSSRILFTSDFFIEFVAIRTQHFSFISHMSQVQIEDDDDFETLISNDDHSVFVEMNIENATAKASDDEMKIEAFTKKRIKREKKIIWEIMNVIIEAISKKLQIIAFATRRETVAIVTWFNV